MVEHEMIPNLKDVRVYHPGFPGVFDFPVVKDVPISAKWSGDDLVLSWDRGTFNDWYSETMDVGQGDVDVFAVVGLIYNTGDEWVCDAAEYMRFGREDAGCRFNFNEKLRHESRDGGGPIAEGEPIAVFLAGLWRHNSNPKREWRHMTEVKFYETPSLSPVGTGVGPVDPDPPPRITEADLRYIASRLGIRVTN